MKGVHSGLRLPVSKEATSDARCPTVRPLASTTYHFRLPARSLPLGKYVDIVNYLCFKRIKRERLEYKPLGKVVKARNPLKGPSMWSRRASQIIRDLKTDLRFVGGLGWRGATVVPFQLRRRVGVRGLLIAVRRRRS